MDGLQFYADFVLPALVIMAAVALLVASNAITGE